MKRFTGLSTLLLLLAVALPAAATQCETFSNHSGHVPDGWTATFTENDIDYGPYEGPIYVDPETAYEGNRSWDRAVKCRTVESTTTTTPITVPSSTTTTTTEATTTTSAASTTTSLPTRSTTTTPASDTTLPAPTSTVPTPSTTGPSNPDAVVLDTLPLTGTGDVWLIAGALSLLAGVGVLTSIRREDES